MDHLAAIISYVPQWGTYDIMAVTAELLYSMRILV